MARDYRHLEHYLNILSNDIYEQPEDTGHTAYAKEVIDAWCSKLLSCKNVLDVGCGQGFCKPLFERLGIDWTGVTVGPDFIYCLDNKVGPVYNEDFNFLPFYENSFDLVFSRHSIEHSFSPLFSLFEWRRVTKQWVCIVVPNPKHFTVRGKNHLSVLYDDQWKWLFEVSKLHMIWEHITDFEYRFMLEKVVDL